MSNFETERLKKYLELVTRKHNGIDTVINRLASKKPTRKAAGLESMASEVPDLSQVKSGIQAMKRGEALAPPARMGLEAIIFPDIRPVIDIVDGKYTSTHELWTQLSNDAAIRNRIESVIPSVGRIELPGNRRYPYGGTGFVVGDGLIMTNRHVAEIFAQGLGDRRLQFMPGEKAGINFVKELRQPDAPTLMVRRVVMIHPYWDMALLSVDGLPENHKPLKLSLSDPREMDGQDIFVIGYPASDPRNPADVQDQLFSGNYGVKRLQPGELHSGMRTSSFGKMVTAATHDCSTLGGNSGSVICNIDTGEVMALHFGGLYQEQNFGVPASELAKDDRVIKAGVQFASNPPGGGTSWSNWWARADTMEAVGDGNGVQQTVQANSSNSAIDTAISVKNADGSVSFEVPLRITIQLGAQQPTPSKTESVFADVLEAAGAKPRNTDYGSREGYNPDFLNTGELEGPAVSVPMPSAKSADVLAPVDGGGDTLLYQNFSVQMHAKRRLALFTASNVTKDPALKKPEAGRDYTRKGLGGESDKWYPDPRVDAKHQLPDVFFTKDRKAFDKGHIVRRDDVAWGRTYDDLLLGNTDSFHVTNCSPQVSGFNRSANGEDNWGDLENHVLSEAANERLCVFAGPVLAADDKVFSGVGERGSSISARIPERFWKVIVARVDNGIAAFGFVLEQDLSDVSWEEFAVPEEFAPALCALTDIEAMTGVVFGPSVRDADQFETLRGQDVAKRSNVKKRKKREVA
jgi:endonuclease G, mitochondrial